MSALDLYAGAGALVFVLALWALVTRGHVVWKVLAVNLMGTGVFLVLLAAPARLHPGVADPLPQGMVLTGIVVAVAATALALGIALRVIARTDSPYLTVEGLVPDPEAPDPPEPSPPEPNPSENGE